MHITVTGNPEKIWAIDRDQIIFRKGVLFNRGRRTQFR